MKKKTKTEQEYRNENDTNLLIGLVRLLNVAAFDEETKEFDRKVWHLSGPLHKAIKEIMDETTKCHCKNGDWE